MSQARVTDYFATRKRNRFNQDEVLLNKQKKSHTLIDTIDLQEAAKIIKQEFEMKTRSKTRLGTKVESLEKESDKIEQEAVIPGPEPEAPKTRRGRKKIIDEELKQKITRLDDKLAKNKENTQVKPEDVKAETNETIPVKQSTKKKVDMATLKAKIQQFNDNLRLVKEASTTESKVSEEVEKLSKVVTETTEKQKTAAFLNFKDLASSDIDLSHTLTLPLSYSLLLDSFRGSDTILKFMHNRQEVCTFLKLKLGIQNITKHNFTVKHLAQIKTVYEAAYIFKQEKMFADFKNDYHLTISPNLDEIEPNPENGAREFTPSALLKRLNKFKTKLFALVKQYHMKFLESIGLGNVDAKEIKRWHPKFDLDNVEEIPESELPKAPNDQLKCKTGQDLLNIAKDIYSTKIKDAIKEYQVCEKASSKSIDEEAKTKLQTVELDLEGADLKSPMNPVPNKEEKIETNEIKVINLKEKKAQAYSALLEKVRNKEKTKALESMILNSEKEKKISKYSNYKEAIRFLLGFYQGEKKSTIETERVCTKMAECLKGKFDEMQAKEFLNEISDDVNFAPNGKKWLTLLKVRNVNYVQLEKSLQINDLWSIMDKIIQNLSN